MLAAGLRPTVDPLPKGPTVKQRLIDVLDRVGKPACLERLADGSEVLILPHGGRILGLFVPASEENFFWTHPALESPDTAAEFYRGEQWHNSGGDRTWLAPEVDFFLPKFPRTDVYHQPRQLDPGDWRSVADEAGRRLVNRMTAVLSRSGTEVELEIAKSIAPALNPLRHEAALAELAGVEFAGYTLQTSLEILRGSPGTAIGLWNLLQFPHGGELIVATYGRALPRIFFGTIPPGDLVAGDHAVRWTMRAAGEQKIGVRAVAVAGRIGYRYPAGEGRGALVVRNVAIDPSGLYADVPWDNSADQGYAVQGCNVHSGLGSFSELEHHAPAAEAGTARNRRDDAAATWAFRGPTAAIDRIAAALLGPPPSQAPTTQKAQ
jgi:hypothetical protein